MTEEVDISGIIVQLFEKLRTEEEKEPLIIVLRTFFNYFLHEDLKSEESNIFERFLTNFNKLKGLVKKAPQRIEIKASNERDSNFRKIVVDLMLDDQRITNLGMALREKHIVVPSGYEAAKNDFCGYRAAISKVGQRIVRSSLEKVKSLANENDIKIPSWFYDVLEEEKFYGFEPDFMFIYDELENSISIYENDDEMRRPYEHALKSLEFLEDKVIGSGLETLYNRWIEAPHVLIPKHVAVKNPQVLLKLYDEAVRTYVAGNNLACIAMCRSLFEHLLIKYFGAPEKDENGKENNLAKIISWSEKKYNSLGELNLHNKREKANTIIHDYSGENIEEKTTLSFIRTVKSLIEKIPATNTKIIVG